MEFDDWVRLVPRPLHVVPGDLGLVVLWVLLTDLAVLGVSGLGGAVRIALGIPFVFFLPGYALTAALFPGRTGSDATTSGSEGGVDSFERLVLGVGLSITTVPIIGLGLNFSPWGVRPAPVVAALSVFTLVATGVAIARRQALPAGERFSIAVYDPLVRTYREAFVSVPRRDRLVNVALAVLIMTSLVGFGYAVAVPRPGESFTELGLLGTNRAGELVADEYPTDVEPGESVQLAVFVGNHERERLTYTIVVQLQPLQDAGRLGPGREIDRFSLTVDANASRVHDHSLVIDRVGTNQRLTYLLYKANPPPDPARANAYRAVHLWINVTEAPTATPQDPPTATPTPTPAATNPTPTP